MFGLFPIKMYICRKIAYPPRKQLHMELKDIQDKEIKIVLHLLDILQNSRLLTKEEKEIYDTLVESIYNDNDEKSTIYNYAQSNKWINAPNGFKNSRGGKDYFTIDSKQIHNYITITTKGNEELSKLLPFAEKWVLNRKQSEHIADLEKQLLESQIDSIKYAQKTTEETIKIAKSAKYAAWASAIGAIFTALLALIKSFI